MIKGASFTSEEAKASIPPKGRDAHANSFTLLRCVAAVAVIISHAYGLRRLPDPIQGWLGLSAGALAVHVFFAISGFLIAGSLYRDVTLWYFCKSRVLRIYPGLIFCVVATAICLAPFSSAGWEEYIHGAFRFAMGMSSLLAFTDRLPGVFEANPYPSAINGSLWTLPLEAQCYLIAGLLYASKLLNRSIRQPVLLLLLSLLAALLLCGVQVKAFGLWRTEALRPFLFSFLVGMLVGTGRDWRPTSSHMAAAVAAGTACAFLPSTPLKAFLLITAVDVLALCVAPYPNRRLIEISNSIPDYSFGIYIYAFPIQQALYYLDKSMSPVANLLLTVALVIPCAALSWHFIESKALSWKRIGNGGRQQLAPAAHELLGETD